MHHAPRAAAFMFRRLVHQTENRRRQRRTRAMSCDRISRPTGIIQNPRTGRKPKHPHDHEEGSDDNPGEAARWEAKAA